MWQQLLLAVAKHHGSTIDTRMYLLVDECLLMNDSECHEQQL